VEKRLPKMDPDTEAFEGAVLHRLVERGYKVQAKVSVGAYRIALVVVGGNRRLAVECDGDNFPDQERLRENMERQAILERLGWKFVRVRGSLFFRDPERALAPIFRRLEELGIRPESPAATAETPARDRSRLEARVIRQAEELRHSWNVELDPGTPARNGAVKSEQRLVAVQQP
jgi:very-short-patch-repair endonuclease